MNNLIRDIGFCTKRIKLWFWWNFIIRKDEFHLDLNLHRCNYNPICEKRVLDRRKIAHVLDLGLFTVWNIPYSYLEGF